MAETLDAKSNGAAAQSAGPASPPPITATPPPPTTEARRGQVMGTDGWKHLDELERLLVDRRGASIGLVRQALENVSAARESLLANPPDSVKALRQTAEAQYRLNEMLNPSRLATPNWILAYILLCLGLLVVGFISTDGLSARLNNLIAGEAFDALWKAIIWGGLGGVTGALYGVWQHVSKFKDYDPDYAMWYYTNPIMGVVLGALIHVVVRTGATAFLAASSANTVDLTYPVYFLAWAVGFQQNLAFRIVNKVIQGIMPADQPPSKEKLESANPEPVDSKEMKPAVR